MDKNAPGGILCLLSTVGDGLRFYGHLNLVYADFFVGVTNQDGKALQALRSCLISSIVSHIEIEYCNINSS